MSDEQTFKDQYKRVEYTNIIYLINSEENTASVIGSEGNPNGIFIPLSINHESKKYYVTSILPNAFKNSKIEFVHFSSDSKLQKIEKNAFANSTIKNIRIPSSVTSIGERAFYDCEQLEIIEILDNSQLQTIDECAFANSSIKSIKIPSKLIELKEGWCNNVKKLTEISVSPENPRYFCYEDKMIIGKSRIEQSNYDCLVFCVRDIQHIKIPNFIEHICSYSFEKCYKLESIEFSDDSKLQTIGKNAFSFSEIERIRIPSSVTSIDDNAFDFSFFLKQIEIPDDSKLKTIGENVFSFTNIVSFKITSKLIELKKGWCCNTKYLTKISVSPENPRYCFFDDKMIIGKTSLEKSNYDCIIFCARDAQQIKIPNFIEHICLFSFEYCERLSRIEIPDDSKLRTIDKKSFSLSNIESINIPSKLTELEEEWCCFTTNLNTISVSSENPRYFCYEDIMIIGKTRIEQSNYDCIVFCVRDILQIEIPNFIEHICPFSFDNCIQLENIEFSDDSKLQTIANQSFSSSAIESIRIPSSVTLIGENAFYDCEQLEVVEIPDDSRLQTIDNDAFSFSSIKSIKIPSSVTSIGENIFSRCDHLRIIEASNPEMISIYQTSFTKCPNAILMIPVHHQAFNSRNQK